MHRVRVYLSGKSARSLRLRQLLCRFSIFRCRKRWSDPRASPTCRHLRSCPLAEPSALSYLESTHARVSKFAPLTPFRINTCKSVSKQRTLIPFRMNTGSVDILVKVGVPQAVEVVCKAEEQGLA